MKLKFTSGFSNDKDNKIRLITGANELPEKVIQLMLQRVLLPTHWRKKHNSETASFVLCKYI